MRNALLVGVSLRGGRGLNRELPLVVWARGESKWRLANYYLGAEFLTGRFWGLFWYRGSAGAVGVWAR